WRSEAGPRRRFVELRLRDRCANHNRRRLTTSSEPRIDERDPGGEGHFCAGDAAIVVELGLLGDSADRTAVEDDAAQEESRFGVERILRVRSRHHPYV